MAFCLRVSLGFSRLTVNVSQALPGFSDLDDLEEYCSGMLSNVLTKDLSDFSPHYNYR